MCTAGPRTANAVKKNYHASSVFSRLPQLPLPRLPVWVRSHQGCPAKKIVERDPDGSVGCILATVYKVREGEYLRHIALDAKHWEGRLCTHTRARRRRPLVTPAHRGHAPSNRKAVVPPRRRRVARCGSRRRARAANGSAIAPWRRSARYAGKHGVPVVANHVCSANAGTVISDD